MRVPGASVFRDLRAALGGVHADAARLRQEHQQLDKQVRDLEEKWGQAVHELAALYLPALDRPSVEGTFAGIRDELLGVLVRKERRAAELTGRLGRLEQAAAQSRTRLAAAAARVQAAQARRHELQAEGERRLESDAVYSRLNAEATAAEAELKQNEERVSEIRQDAQEKLPAYEASSLFQYLHARRFGTAEYRGRGLIRRLDRWVANLIEYGRAQRSYDFLGKTPALMEQEIARRQGEHDDRSRQITHMAQRIIEDLGLPKVMEEQAAAEAEQQRLQTTHDEDAERVQQAAGDVAQLDQSQGQFYEDALNRFRRFLADAQTSLLQSRAAQTPEPTDDEIVNRMRFLASELAELQPQAAARLSEGRDAERRAEGLEFIVRRFEQSNFHIDRSSFEPGFDVSALTAQYRSGALDRDACWQAIRRAQQTTPTEFERKAGEVLTDLVRGLSPPRRFR